MKTSLWLGVGLIGMLQPVFANGGGYFRGGMEQAGDVAGFEPSQTDKIRILDEKLTVSLGNSAADVEVRYLMRNETDKKVKVRFGFPVEESFDWDMMDAAGENASNSGNQLKYCQKYVITSAGKPVAAKWQGEKKVGDDKRFTGIEGWLISEITFAAGEEKPVMIRFRSGYPSAQWSVSDDDSTSAAIFKYRLSTAACWAGTIGSGRVVLKPDGIDPRELKVLKPVNRFKKTGDAWVWDFENLEPTMADDLEIEARPGIHRFGGHDGSGRYQERGDKWFMTHTNYQIRASSTLPPDGDLSYEPDKLKNHWADGAWSEGAKGSGVGEWLELKPVVPKPLNAIEIEPGMTKSDELFSANARPKKVLVELNGEQCFTVDIPDDMAVHRIPILDYTKPVGKIRLTFQEVWPGTRFEDLCVSGIRLQVKLDKKPKVEPAR